MRKAVIERKTNETQIALTLCLDGGIKSVKTDCGFFNHMLELFAVHSGFGLEVECRGIRRLISTTRWRTWGSRWGRRF